MDEATDRGSTDPESTGTESSDSDALDRRLTIGRPEFGDALDGLRARMSAAVRGQGPPTVGRYRLGRVIGSGSFGTVYEAEDPELDRRVAVKVLTVRSTKEAARVVREAQLLATLSHPNIVGVFEVGTLGDGRSPYVVMELIDGLTLRQWLAEGERSWRELVEIALGAAQGLLAAHRAGIVHRDIKPENVLMGHDGRPRVIDFGLARTIDGEDDSASRTTAPAEVSPQLTATGQVMGTPAYMAPEMFMGECTPLSDQYGLCVMLYEGLFGERPFVAQTTEELRARVVTRDPKRPADRRGVPRAVETVVMRGLRRRPEDRFAGLGELAAALESAARPRTWGRGVGVAVALGGLMATSIAVAKMSHDAAESTAGSVEASADAPAPALDPERLAEIAALEAEADRLRTLLATAKLDDAQKLSASLLERARALDHAPMVVELLLLRGQTLALATDYEHAIPLLEEAYFLAEDEALPLEAARAASELVGLWGYQGDEYEKAHQWKDHADAAFERAAIDPLDHVPYVLSVAGLSTREGDTAGAIAMLRAAVARVEHDARARSSEHALLLKTLGRELYTSGDTEAAVELTREAAAIYAEHDGPRSLTRAAALDNLGVFLTGLGQFEEALTHHREALEIREQLLEPGHMDLGRSYGNMGRVLGELGRNDEAFAQLERSIAVFSARLGPGNSSVGLGYSMRADIHAKRGPEGRADAIRDYERATRIFDGAGVIYAPRAASLRATIVELGGTPPPAPSIAIAP